jgi:pimeloyl-ACP methyl ester carboxylesterase
MIRMGGLSADIQGRADHRPPLVFLHGLTFDHRQWDPVREELGDRQSVVFDLPGHGGSPRRDSYDLEEIAALVHEAVTEAGLEAPVVVGHSISGVIATTYAAKYEVRGVVNIDQVLLVNGFSEMLRDAEPILRGPDHLQLWNRLVAGMHVELLPPAAQELVRTATDPRQDLLLGYWHEVLTVPPDELAERSVRELRAIQSKGIAYHYVTGQEPPEAYRRWLESAIPSVEITVLPGSGHFVHLAHPRELAKILAA